MAAAADGLRSSTIRGLVWVGLGTGGQALIQLAALTVLARLITPVEFGVVAAALVVVGISTVFSHLGVGPAIVQRPDLRPEHVRTAFTISMLLGLAVGALLWLSAGAIAGFFSHDELTDVVSVLAILFPLQGLCVVAESLMQRKLRFRTLAAVDFAAVTFGHAVVGVLCALAGWGVWALVAAQLAMHLLRTVALLLLEPHSKAPMLEGRALRELLFFGGGFALARISNYLASQGDNLVIGRWLGLAALGVYGRAYQLMVAPASLFGQVLDRVLFPTLARVQDHRPRLASAYRRGVALIALIALPGSAVLIVLAPEVVYVVLGPAWEMAILPLQILAIGLLFRMSYKMSDSLARATGAVYRRAWRQACYAALVFAGALIGQQWGLSGVAAGVVAAVCLNFLLMAHLSLRLTGLSWRAFAAVHLPGLALAGLVALELVPLAQALRSWEATPLVILSCAAAVCLLTVYVAQRLPRIFLGNDGRWMLQTLVGSARDNEPNGSPTRKRGRTESLARASGSQAVEV